MDNFEQLIKYVKHTGSVISSIDCIIRYESDVKVIKDKLRDLLDKDARFDKMMYKENKKECNGQ